MIENAFYIAYLVVNKPLVLALCFASWGTKLAVMMMILLTTLLKDSTLEFNSVNSLQAMIKKASNGF